VRAIRVHAPGPPEVLRFEEVSPPTPGTGQVRIRVEAAGVNFLDVYQRTGLYKIPMPAILGQEAGGTVDAVGPGVADWKSGDRAVSSNVLGAYAEYALVPAERLVPLPAGVSTRQGAAVLLQGITAHYLTHSTYQLRTGDTCLVHAAAGGVGLLLCQVASRRGARVLATVSTEEKAALAREAGAAEVILYTRDDFETEVKRLTGGAGVQVVYDSVGRSTFTKGLNCLAPRGMMVLFGQSGGAVKPLDPQVLNQKGSLFLTRPSIGHYVATRAELLQRAGDVLQWVADGTLRVRIGREFRLMEAVQAHLELEGRMTTGKVLLIP
jgi:NADPH:quinone reductase